MKLKKKQKRLLLTLVLLFIIGIYEAATPARQTAKEALTITVQPTRSEHIRVAKVIDGDTVQLEDGRTLRYIGIDTPETKHPQKGKECLGQEATDENKKLVEGKPIRLEKDLSETDRYGRLLRYVYVKTMEATGEAEIMVNEEIVRKGFARAISYPPDIKHQDLLRTAEREARENNRGLWNMCSKNLG